MTEALRNYESFVNSLRNFESWIGDAAPGAMDVDCLIERNCQFLVFESKPWRGDSFGVQVSYGQHLALAAMSEIPNFTVYLVGEDGKKLYVAQYDRNAPIKRRREVWWPKKSFVRMNAVGLRELVRAWWEEAMNVA